ncbi:hypothetical protein KKB44_00890 [Candidatus Micrarchaeota archaeon]|nr:hypothetical protein [Candidatus Micrarchaeota archaeon]
MKLAHILSCLMLFFLFFGCIDNGEDELITIEQPEENIIEQNDSENINDSLQQPEEETLENLVDPSVEVRKYGYDGPNKISMEFCKSFYNETSEKYYYLASYYHGTYPEEGDFDLITGTYFCSSEAHRMGGSCNGNFPGGDSIYCGKGREGDYRCWDGTCMTLEEYSNRTCLDKQGGDGNYELCSGKRFVHKTGIVFVPFFETNESYILIYNANTSNFSTESAYGPYLEPTYIETEYDVVQFSVAQHHPETVLLTITTKGGLDPAVIPWWPGMPRELCLTVFHNETYRCGP